MRFGVIRNQGSGASLMLLMVLSTFRDMNLEPIIEPTGNSSVSVFHYIVDRQELYEMPADPDAKIISMIRDPRSVLCSIYTGLADFKDWQLTLEASKDLQAKFDIMWVRFEHLFKEPLEMQDAVGNWLYYKEFYQHYFKDVYEDYVSLDIPFKDSIVGGLPIEQLLLDESMIDWWRYSPYDHLHNQIEQYPELLDWVQMLGYESNNDWVEEYDKLRECFQQDTGLDHYQEL
jgi:hypothetical protein